MKREEAIERIKTRFDKWALDDGDMKAIQTLIPELAESEDEKFRKYIVRACKETIEADDRGLALSMDTTKKLYAYLEKQKELPFVKDVVLGYPGLYFYDGERLHFQGNPAMEEKRKEQKPIHEDERIREIITDSVFYQYGAGVEYKDVLDYLDKLEKQKEQRLKEPGYKHEDYFCERCQANAFNAGRESVLKEQKPAEWKPQPESLEALMYAIEGKWEAIKPTSYLSRRLEDLYEGLVNTFNVDESLIVELPKVASRAYTSEDIEELRELKRKIDESMVPTSISCAHENDFVSKPAEWSEEDETCLENALWCVEKTRHFVAKDACDLDACRSAKRLLESLPERFNLQPKQEWSEKDEKIWQDIFELCNRFGYDDACRLLKTIRPQSHTVSIKDATKFGNLEYERGVKDGIQSEKNRHWKPSEEQMKALKEVAYNIVGTGTATDVHLVQLYEQLKSIQ